MKEAFVFWNAGLCSIIDCRTQRRISRSRHFRRATQRAQDLGYAVRVYKGEHAVAPRDAVQVSTGSYVLPRTSSKQRSQR